MLEALLLGAAQDAGLPQAGCYCPNCSAARANPAQRDFVASLAVLDHAQQVYWLIDATPDFREQLDLVHQVAPNYALQGIFLTHAHMGHYLGLAHLGREAMNTQDLPVYATPALVNYLKQNGPWSQLVSAGNIALQIIQPNQALTLSPQTSILPLRVPHRAEYSDTVAYVITGSQKSMFYCPDIDRWEDWDQDLPQFLQSQSVALVDGTFFSSTELPGRNLAEIPHPLMTQTMNRLQGTACEVVFIHLNHSNPVWQEGTEQAEMAAKGFKVGRCGMRWKIA